MYGGHGCRGFYAGEIDRIETARLVTLPHSAYTDSQIQAGFERLARVYGFYGTLLFMEKSTPYRRDELVRWTVAEFNTNFAYIANHNFIMEKYEQILKDNKKAKWDVKI